MSALDLEIQIRLAQVGMQAACRFAQKLRELRLLPNHAAVLQALGTSAGISQRALGRKLSISHNRVHELVHELEDRSLVDRRGIPGDLRAHALRLTVRGDQALVSIRRSARALDEEICAGLSNQQQAQPGALLSLVAARLRLTPGLDARYHRHVRRGSVGKQAEEAMRRRWRRAAS